ncbi:dihydrodipicolinate reductase [Mycobacterium tuberculosis]|nr:dihydrodipicolinate reductase [Mycobacterium tuberculosis]
MSLRVIQWATGSVGVAAIKGVLQHPELELVGCWVHSAAKSGKDVGEIIGSPPLGVIATNSIDDVLALDADAVIYAPLLPSVDEVAALLRSGKNVVTPLGWFYPSEKEAAPLEVAAQAGNATLHGAGIGPGAVTELFPLLLSVMSTGVTFVRSEEFSDLRSYGAPDVLRYVMGFGGTPDSALTGPMQKILDGGFLQSVRLCVDRLGFAADPQIRTSQEVAVATAPIDSPIGVIEPGQVAGRRFHWEALVEDTVVVQDRRELVDGIGKSGSPLVIRAGRRTLRDRSARQPGHLRHHQGLATADRGGRLEEQPRDRGNRGALRQRDPGNLRRPGGDPELFRPAAHHRPGRSRAGTLELLAASPAGMSRIGRVIQWQSLSSSSNRERFRCNPRMRSVARWRQRCR